MMKKLAEHVKKTSKRLGIKIKIDPDDLTKRYEKDAPLLVSELPGMHDDLAVFVHAVEYGKKEPLIHRPMRISYKNVGDEYWTL
jgi:hypothetical protein